MQGIHLKHRERRENETQEEERVETAAHACKGIRKETPEVKERRLTCIKQRERRENKSPEDIVRKRHLERMHEAARKKRARNRAE